MGDLSEPTDGRINSNVSDIQEKYNRQWSDIEDNDPVPKDVPSIIELKKILPKHCFQSDIKTSFYYVMKDLIFVLLLYISMRIVELQPYGVIVYAYRPIYCLLQGTMFWAIFVLGHDCGHGSFSSYDIINDITGTFLHTIIRFHFILGNFLISTTIRTQAILTRMRFSIP